MLLIADECNAPYPLFCAWNASCLTREKKSEWRENTHPFTVKSALTATDYQKTTRR